jgi:hypothetical protein
VTIDSRKAIRIRQWRNWGRWRVVMEEEESWWGPLCN